MMKRIVAFRNFANARKKQDSEGEFNGITFRPSFMNIGHLVKKLLTKTK
jgi:hypothetical protein